jgi:hypothetical protein
MQKLANIKKLSKTLRKPFQLSPIGERDFLGKAVL